MTFQERDNFNHALHSVTHGHRTAREAYLRYKNTSEFADKFPWFNATVKRVKKALNDKDMGSLGALVACLGDVHPVATYGVWWLVRGDEAHNPVSEMMLERFFTIDGQIKKDPGKIRVVFA